MPVNVTENVSESNQPGMGTHKPSPLSYKAPHGHFVYVDKVIVTRNETESYLYKVLLRQSRRPEVGDKFSSRHGQKGVCGLIVNQVSRAGTCGIEHLGIAKVSKVSLSSCLPASLLLSRCMLSMVGKLAV